MHAQTCSRSVHIFEFSTASALFEGKSPLTASAILEKEPLH